MKLTVHWRELNASHKRLFAFGVTCVLLLLVANVVYRVVVPPGSRNGKSSFPDLKRCTRVEICFLTSALDYVCPQYGRRGLLSSVELERLQSLETIVVDDPGRISAIVRVLESASYDGPIQKRGRFRPREFRLVCYRDGDPPVSLRVLIEMEKLVLATVKRNTFKLKRPFLALDVLLQDARPFMERIVCAGNISSLGSTLDRISRVDSEHSPPKKWCDAIVRRLRDSDENTKIISLRFQCRAADSGKCHYAMNASWEPNSPPDGVQLFETRAGWNKRGGPELFTFDNHDPKGGCVLLNDGTVKFIRTEEELRALRWE